MVTADHLLTDYEWVTWPTFQILGRPPYLGRFELETSNLTWWLTARDTNGKKYKIRSKGSGRGHATYFWNFGTPSIYRERFELQTSYLAHRLANRVTNKKCKIRSKGIGKGSRDLLLKFWNPLHMSGTVWARNFKFGMQHLGKKRNIRSKGAGRSYVT